MFDLSWHVSATKKFFRNTKLYTGNLQTKEMKRETEIQKERKKNKDVCFSLCVVDINLKLDCSLITPVTMTTGFKTQCCRVSVDCVSDINVFG